MSKDVNPTRMELIKTKERIKLANKGHKLLKQKRDALIMEFFKLLKKARDMRGVLNKKITEAYKALTYARLYHSSAEIQKLALDVRRDISLEVDVKNVMGVKIPDMEVSLPPTPPYSFVSTSAKLDDAIKKFSEILELSLELAQTETALRRLIAEIEKTKRRVNALEYIVLPELNETKKMISLRLDEMERDSFVSLKAIKRKLEKEASA